MNTRLPVQAGDQLLNPEFEFLLVDEVRIEIVLADAKVASGLAGSIVDWQVPDFEATVERCQGIGARLVRGPLQESDQLMGQMQDTWGGAGIRWILENKKALVDAELALNEGGGPTLDDKGKVTRISLQTAEKTYQDYEIVAKGTTGHSSVPLDDNAIIRLSRALARLGDHKFPNRLLPVTRAYYAARAKFETPELAAAMKALAESKGELPADAVKVLEKDPTNRADLHTTCVATMLSGGTRVNALPAEAVSPQHEPRYRNVDDEFAFEIRLDQRSG